VKNRKMLTYLLIIAVSIALAGCCKPPKLSSVPADHMVAQHTNTWCWAASTEMISEYYGHRIDQCLSSQYVHSNPADCEGCPDYCSCWNVCGATLAQIQDNWTHWSFEYQYKTSSLSWTDLKKTISTTCCCGKSPIMTIWWWYGGGGHVVTAYGYAEAGGENWVAYFNPWPPDCSRDAKAGTCSGPVSGGEDCVNTYAAFVDDGDHQWGNSFYSFKYVGP